MYCTIAQLESQLNQALTSANPQPLAGGVIQKGSLQTISNTINFGVILQNDADYFIQQADAIINAALSQQYLVPLEQTNDVTMQLLTSIDEYSTDTVELDRASVLSQYDVLYFFDGTNSETATVAEVIDTQTVQLTSTLIYTFSSTNTRVLRIKFPDPIPFLSAKLACAMIFKKYFTAQVDPGKSEYGESMRAEVIQELNNIREGRTILRGIPRIGWRFANSELVDRYNVKGAFDQDGTRSDTGGR